MNRKAIVSAALSLALCAGMSLQAHAVYDPMKAMEERSRQAVAAAVQQGIIPPDSTIYDCGYGEGANGETVVVRYKDDNGNWIDVATGRVAPAQQSAPAAMTPDTSEDDLAEYADEVFRIVNEEREDAGLDPLERSDYLEDAAQTRAEECASINDIRVDGRSHTRPDGSAWFTVFGITENYNYGENTGQGKNTAEKQMASWMASDGHRANILRDDYTEIGIGVAVSSKGKTFAVQIFSRP